MQKAKHFILKKLLFILYALNWLLFVSPVLQFLYRKKKIKSHRKKKPYTLPIPFYYSIWDAFKLTN